MRSRGKFQMDEDFLQFAFHEDRSAIMKAVAMTLDAPPRHVRLIGSAATINDLSVYLERLGYGVERCLWTYADPPSAVSSGEGILCEIPKSFDDWARCAVVTSDGTIRPLWRLVFPLSLFREMFSIYEYNASTVSDLFEVYRGRSEEAVGRRSNGRLARVEAFIPLRGKTIIEFGPSDGNQSADLLGLQPAHLLAVEGRPENIVKLLVAKWAMGWTNFDVVLDNFQTPGAWAARRYDFVYAQGVYYHCQNPLIFLDILTRLGDAIFIGGWVATESKPRGPWVLLEHERATYRGKAYDESYHFLSGLAPQSYMLERPELERFLVERGFSIRYCDVQTAENELGTEFVELLATKQPNQKAD
jgi:hypothetical protein